MILAVSAHEDQVLRQFDVCTAFLNGELEEEVYVCPPPGAEHLAVGDKQVLRLPRALYGLKQALRAWNKRLEGELSVKGFEQSDADPALLIVHGEGGAVLVMFHVDDGLVAAKTTSEADALVDVVGSMFEIWKLGEPANFLGIHICRDRSAGTITVDQEDKATALAAELGVSGTFRIVPMTPEVFGELRGAQPGEPMADKRRYQQVVGSLLHLAQCTRSDIALPVAAMAAYSSAPSAHHYAVMLDLVRYVGGTTSRGITYGGNRQSLGFWCDANFATCKDTRRSITGWVVTMYGGAESWSSKKQAATAASSMDAEYQACGAAAREGMSLRKALGEMALLSPDFLLGGPVIIWCDNKAALSLCKDRKEGRRVEHIDVIHHFARGSQLLEG
jgi:hypothetical protein